MDDLILHILKGIEAGKPTGQKDKWERCWGATPALEAPPYYASGFVRENGVLKAVMPGYEYERFRDIRDALLKRYCPEGFHEFGCGNGHNLVNRNAVGYDWSESAVRKLNEAGQKAEVFDMFKPRPMDLRGQAVVTIHAMEQLGKDFHMFLAFLLDAKPRIVVHLEPLIELYEDNLLDYLAVMYHRKRGYLEGYVDAVKAVGEVIELKRNYFGSLFHEANSVLVWRP